MYSFSLPVLMGQVRIPLGINYPPHVLDNVLFPLGNFSGIESGHVCNGKGIFLVKSKDGLTVEGEVFLVLLLLKLKLKLLLL